MTKGALYTKNESLFVLSISLYKVGEYHIGVGFLNLCLVKRIYNKMGMLA
jgi:hypothetical protein